MLQIAQVLKTNGTDGALVLNFRDICPEDIDLKEPVFIEFDGLPVPFFIESMTRRGVSKAIVRLTDICTADDAEELCGRPVYASEDSIEGYEEEEGLEALVGWTLLDADGNEVGVIEEFNDIPGNPCVEVAVGGDGSRVLVPLHEDLIVELDPQACAIRMEIPEGLLGL